MKQKNFDNIYKEVLIQRAKFITPVVHLTMLLLIYTLPFLNYIIFVDKDIRIPQDIGFVNKLTYDQYDENHMQSPVDFDVKIELYFNRLEINGENYQVVFSNSEMFDIGMVNDSWDYSDINLYSFDFLYGEKYVNHNQIVITENISQKLFQTNNSVNQEIEIGTRMFVVSGVIKSKDQLTDYIYMSDQNMDLVTVDYQRYDAGYLLKDEKLYLKLYQLGGYNLLTRTSSYLTQSQLPGYFYPLFNIAWIIFFLILGAIGEGKSSIDIDEKRKQDKMINLWSYKKLGVIKYTYQSMLNLLYLGIFLSTIGIALVSNYTSLLIAPLVVFSYPLLNIYAILILFVLLVDIVSKAIRTRKKNEMNQLRMEYLKIRFKMIKPYVKRIAIPFVIIITIVLVILIIIF